MTEPNDCLRTGSSWTKIDMFDSSTFLEAIFGSKSGQNGVDLANPLDFRISKLKPNLAKMVSTPRSGPFSTFLRNTLLWMFGGVGGLNARIRAA